MQTLTLTKPDDWHVHFRDGKVLADTVAYTARQFARAIVMPNLRPPVTSVDQALAYRKRIVAAVPEGLAFDPLMTLYLTESMSPDEIDKAANCVHIAACKLYPAGATTNSDAGVSNLRGIYPILAAMEEHDIPLLIHGEIVDDSADIFDREKLFIDRELVPLCTRFSYLRVVLEHITTQDAVAFINAAPSHIAATITAHHLLYNRNALLAGGIKPHFYCLPVLKREMHRLALLEAATSGSSQFFLGTDSAPHELLTKETYCGCAGCFTSPLALELYAKAFESVGRLDQLERFASLNGPAFYRLPANSAKVVLEKVDWKVPEKVRFGDETAVPLMAGETLGWRMRS